MKQIRRQRKMSDDDVAAAVALIEGWVESKPKTPLTWANVEKRTGFTRPALVAKRAIEIAFGKAKQVSRNAVSPEVARLFSKIEELERENRQLKTAETEWLTQWQRVVVHAHRLGIDEGLLQEPIPGVRRRHTEDSLAVFEAASQGASRERGFDRRTKKVKDC